MSDDTWQHPVECGIPFKATLTDALGIPRGATSTDILNRADAMRRAWEDRRQASDSAEALHRVEVAPDGGARHWVRSAGEEEWRPVSREEFDDSFSPQLAEVAIWPIPPGARERLDYGVVSNILEQIALSVGLPRDSAPERVALTVDEVIASKDRSIKEMEKTADARWEVLGKIAAAMDLPFPASSTEIISRAGNLRRRLLDAERNVSEVRAGTLWCEAAAAVGVGWTTAPSTIVKTLKSLLRTKNDAITDIAREKAERENRLRSKNYLLDARLLQSSEDNKALAARIQRLRKALVPFAKEARIWGADTSHSLRNDSIPLSLNMGTGTTTHIAPLALHISDFFNAAAETRDPDPPEGEVEYFGGDLEVGDPIIYGPDNPEPRQPRSPAIRRAEFHGIEGSWFDSVEYRLGLLEERDIGGVRCGAPGSDEEKIRQLKEEAMNMHARRRELTAERDAALAEQVLLQGAVVRLTEMGEGLLCRADYFEGSVADARGVPDVPAMARLCETLRLEAEAKLWTAIRGYGVSLPGTECKREEEAAAVTAAMEELVVASRRNPLRQDAVATMANSEKEDE